MRSLPSRNLRAIRRPAQACDRPMSGNPVAASIVHDRFRRCRQFRRSIDCLIGENYLEDVLTKRDADPLCLSNSEKSPNPVWATCQEADSSWFCIKIGYRQPTLRPIPVEDRVLNPLATKTDIVTSSSVACRRKTGTSRLIIQTPYRSPPGTAGGVAPCTACRTIYACRSNLRPFRSPGFVDLSARVFDLGDIDRAALNVDKGFSIPHPHGTETGRGGEE